jgi:hypothetical protein
MAARDLRFVEGVLSGPDMLLRRAALRAVRTLPVSDEAAVAVLDDAPADLRRALYRTLLQARRAELADRLLPEVREQWGDREAALLLPACTGAVAARWLPELAHAVPSWWALGRRHPGAVLDIAEKELSEGAARWIWSRRRGNGLSVAASAEPERVLSLLERHDLVFLARRLPPAVLRPLFDAGAGRMLLILGDHLLLGDPFRGGLPPVLTARLSSCSVPELVLAARGDAYRLGTMLRALPPGRRAAVFDAACEQRGGSPGLWAMPLLGALPPERAAAEARRMLEWHDSVWHSARKQLDDPDLPLRLISYLPYDEAAGPLTEAAIGGDPRRRGLARTLLIECAARTGDRALIAELLTGLAGRTAGEQDPLREALLTAVRNLPPGLLDDACAEPLERIAVTVTEALDSSPATCVVLRGLARRILRHHESASSPALVTWALGVYEKLVARSGADALACAEPWVPSRLGRRGRRRMEGRPRADDHRLDMVLRAGQELDLLAVLRPHLRAARARGDFALVVALTRALGGRARALEELQQDLRAAVLHAPEALARQAAEFWLADAADRVERALGLVREDASTVMVPAVWRVVARHRTDLLRPLLDGERTGRFTTAAPWVPEIEHGTPGRWTPDQREHVRGLLGTAIGDARSPISARMAAVRAAGRLPGAVAQLAELAARPEPVLAEAALEALADSDTPADALPVLLEHARGRFSRVAVAAAAKCCLSVPPSRLRPVLERALFGPDGKVTLRKEAARQLVRTRVPGAADLLLRAWADPDTHRDVRVAVAVGLRQMPEDPRTLAALSAAVDRYAGELMSRTLFQADPLQYAPAGRPAYADLIRRLLIATDDPGVRFRGARAFAGWVPWYQGGVEQIIAAAGDPGEAGGEAEMTLLVTLLRIGMVRGETLDVLSRLIAVPPDAGGSAHARARARVRSIIQALDANAAGRGAERWRHPLAREAVRLLAAEPHYLPQAAQIAVHLLPVSTGPQSAPDPAGPGIADGLCDLADLLAGRPVLAARTTGMVIRHLRGYGGRDRVAPAELLTAAERLAGRDDLAAGLLAVTLTRIADEHTGHPAEWRRILQSLRRSRHPEVGQEAWDVPTEYDGL